MNEINIKALIYTIITIISIPLFIYAMLTNVTFLVIIGIILSIIVVTMLFCGLYIFFDEYF